MLFGTLAVVIVPHGESQSVLHCRAGLCPCVITKWPPNVASKVTYITTAHHDPEFSVLSGFNWDVEAARLF